ncbi:DUF4183 domain-containing protein [Serpentinicella alkaliphila]|uniref:Uncharacterized protein DUF4183 n=1 Tax=Serpentinicella alkaliphila TaxID=1734049 RepID=A0A4R2T888_9FIRM|nr:DUF4183 domain-containing protein [Serpentinicella alkaliphila]QUH27044.1 DUF4183 domain-containing protein [Serpentinicella alkaliphila]TCP93398.1 uncharacterized protein DUF4183 [Serpentinicella alkaliphila]
MPASLFKLVIDAQTTTTTKPNVQRFFYQLNTGDVDNGTLTIVAASFVDDSGDAVVTIPTAVADNGYYMLLINGVLQQEGLYTVTENNVVVTDATGIPENAPIVLVVTNFDPESDTTIIS